jgi:Bifunctional nuclease domain
VLLAWLNPRTLAGADSFGAWLARIALRVCHGWLRYQARQAWSLVALLGGRLLPEPVDWAATPPAAVEQVESRAGTRRFDARPSDAIALALETGAPVSVARPVMNQAGRLRAELSESPGSWRTRFGPWWRSLREGGPAY